MEKEFTGILKIKPRLMLTKNVIGFKTVSQLHIKEYINTIMKI